MAGFDPTAPMRQGLNDLTNTLGTLAQLKRQDQQYADEAPLRALQMQQAQQGVEQGSLTLASLKGAQGALTDQYGTTGQPDALPRAMSFQAQESEMAAQQKQAMEKQKYAFDEFSKVAKAVADGVVSEDEASAFYHAGLRMAGIDLDKAGVKMSFKKQGGYFSGPITPDALFMVDGKPTPYGGTGTIEKARVVGRDEATGKPIFEMDEHTTFKEAPRPEYKSRERVDGDRTVFEESKDGGTTWNKVSEGPRYKPESHGSDEKDYRKQSYQLQKEIRGDKYINQADDSGQKLTAMKNAYAEGKKTGNYTGADQAIGYYVNKLFDPDSVVMVSEFQRVAQSQGVPDKIVGSLQGIATGGIKLTDKSRDALIRTVDIINSTAQDRKSERLRQYRMDAVSLGLDPDRVLAGRDGNKPLPRGGSQQPKQGQTKKGGRFTIIEVK